MNYPLMARSNWSSACSGALPGQAGTGRLIQRKRAARASVHASCFKMTAQFYASPAACQTKNARPPVIEDERILTSRGTTSVRPGARRNLIEHRSMFLRCNGRSRRNLDPAISIRRSRAIFAHPPPVRFQPARTLCKGERGGTLSFIAFFLYKIIIANRRAEVKN